jgi:hypothetical protein
MAVLPGSSRDNVDRGGPGNDRLEGGQGNDTLDGQEGAHTLSSGSGAGIPSLLVRKTTVSSRRTDCVAAFHFLLIALCFLRF